MSHCLDFFGQILDYSLHLEEKTEREIEREGGREGRSERDCFESLSSHFATTSSKMLTNPYRDMVSFAKCTQRNVTDSSCMCH